MKYSVEENVQPPQRDGHIRAEEGDINGDLEEDTRGMDPSVHTKKSPDGVSIKSKHLDDSLARESEILSRAHEKKVSDIIKPEMSIPGVRKSPFTTSKKSYRTKLTTGTKSKRSKVSRRGRSMETSSHTRAQTGAISMAMKVLNMDEEEKESVYFSTTEHNVKMKDQIEILFGKLQFFTKAYIKEQGKTRRGDYFTIKDETFREKDNQVGSIMSKMKKVKAQINIMKKQLRMSYDVDKITQLENDRKAKVKEWRKLSKVNEKLKADRAKARKEYETIQNEGNWGGKKEVLAKELRESKTESRKLYYANLEKKKDLINKHENVVLLDKKLRNMQQLCEVKGKIPKEPKEEEAKSEPGMEGLDEKVKEATKMMEDEEKKTELEIQKQKGEIANLQHLVEIAALRLREKEQENRL